MSGEFERIARYFKPLAREPYALGLLDDAASLAVPAGQELIVTTDTLVGGVHFFAEDAAADIARKALRVNLSDLASKGADPFVYTLVLALPPDIGDAWLEEFAASLGEDQSTYGIGLIGGDMTATQGPLAVTVGAFGLVPHGQMLKRTGARPGDRVWLTGTVGDAALGLRIIKGEVTVPQEAAAFVRDRYLRPQPRVAFGPCLRGLASAAMDVSDGLIGDASHLARAGHVDVVIESGALPLSPAARAALASEFGLFATLVAGGDDYEILFTAPPESTQAIQTAAAECGLPVACIGEIRTPAAREPRVILRDAAGKPVEIGGQGGWRHW
jgi:thiamine-monophosphate kinase